MLSKQVKQRRAVNRMKRSYRGSAAMKLLGISPEVLAHVGKMAVRKRKALERALSPHWYESKRDLTLEPNFPQLESFRFAAVQLFDTKGQLMKTIDGSMSANIPAEQKQAFDKVFSDKREMKVSDIGDTSGLHAMYPAGHWGWKVGGPELNPELHVKKDTHE